jgi:hypothetical protein
MPSGSGAAACRCHVPGRRPSSARELRGVLPARVPGRGGARPWAVGQPRGGRGPCPGGLPSRPPGLGASRCPRAQLASLAEAIQDLKVELIETPALAHSLKRRQQVAGEPQPSSRAGSSRMRLRREPCTRPRSGRPGRRWCGAGRRTAGAAGPAAGLDDRPELIRHKVVSKSRHGLGSCQTNPKGAKRRLRLIRPGRDNPGSNQKYLTHLVEPPHGCVQMDSLGCSGAHHRMPEGGT